MIPVRRLAFLFLAAALLGACIPPGTLGAASPTPVLQFIEGAPTEIPSAAATPTLEPFRFDLPAPGSEPISGWRPPLYAIPWAVSPYDHFYFARPIAADVVNWPLANYRYGGVFFGTTVHTGVDIDANEGTPVLAAGPGTIVWAGWGLFTEAPGNKADPYGLAIVIRHEFGYEGQQLYTVYAHMSKLEAIVGQWVDTGDEIGRVGATGATTGPHLHFEVRFPSNSFHQTYNPELWMAPPQGWGVLVGRVADENNKTLQQLEVYVRNESTGNTIMVRSYGGKTVNHDPYYDENLVLGDLVAGLYKVTLTYEGKEQQNWMNVYPGQVTYFTFKGQFGFKVAPPPTPDLDFLPPTPRP